MEKVGLFFASAFANPNDLVKTSDEDAQAAIDALNAIVAARLPDGLVGGTETQVRPSVLDVLLFAYSSVAFKFPTLRQHMEGTPFQRFVETMHSIVDEVQRGAKQDESWQFGPGDDPERVGSAAEYDKRLCGHV